MDDKNKKASKEVEIDLLELTQKIWSKRKFILIASLIGFVLGIIIAFSIPKEYQTVVTLSPETKSTSNGGMGALAAMAGFNLNAASGESMSPDIYPNIVYSTPFMVGLFDIHVKSIDSSIDTTLYTYLNDFEKYAWWHYIFKAPFKVLSFFSSKKKNYLIDQKTSHFFLSKEEDLVLSSLKDRVGISVNKKTGVISLSTTMQDPEVSALLADTITSYLQNYVIKYRTEKARKDLEFTQKLYNEAKEDYYHAQQKYASYSDGNLNIVSARYGTTLERLQNEMNLAYGVYNQVAQQLQLAKVKVQDRTPVYSVIEPAITPNKPVKPDKKLIVIGLVFLAFIGSSISVVFKDIFNAYKEEK